MPVLNRRPRVMAPRQGSPRSSTESNEGVKEQLWIVDEDYEKPQKEMDFPSAQLAKMPLRPKSRQNLLRINTYSKQDLHDRYLSSEEEPSPSPDDGGHSYEDELTQSAPEVIVDEAIVEEALDASGEEFQPEIAIAVPIIAYGRPKLIDITNLAPMHKRKRPAKPLLPHPAAKNKNGAIRPSATAASATAASAPGSAPGSAPASTPAPTSTPAPAGSASALPTVVDENHSPSAHDALAEPMPASNTRQLKRKESFSIPAPESWLPDDSLAEVEDDRDLFPSINLRSHPGYRHEYEPFAIGLDTPRRSSNRSLHHFSTRVHDADHFSASSLSQPTPLTPTGMGGTPAGWKGLTRSLSLVKRNSGSHQQVNKKPKMIPRGAGEREDSPVIPPFPFESEVAVAS